MAPTIRIDEDVYSWLQSNARPFEDTPNSVLRRLAGLSSRDKDEVATAKNTSKGNSKTSTHERSGLDGRQLNIEWNAGARHALYSRDGSWYENLERFPGALFDPNGYVLFQNEEEYRKSPQLRIGKKTNVSAGISKIPGYVRKR